MQRQLTRREREVWAACDHLFSSGITGSNITGEALQTCLAEMGYRKGSFNEIYRYRKTWEQSRNVDLRAPLPPLIKTEPLPDPLLQAVQQVRLILQKESADQISQIKQEAEQTVTTLNDELQVARQELAELQRILSEKESSNLRLQEEGEKAASLIHQLEQDTIHWKAEALRFGQLAEERLKQHEIALNELKGAHAAEINRLKQQLESNKATYEKTINEYKDNQEKQRHQWIAEKDQLQTNNLKLEKQLQKAELADQHSREQSNLYSAELEKANHELMLLKDENSQLKHNQVKLETIMDFHKKEAHDLKQKLQAQEQLYMNEHGQLLIALEQVKLLKDKLRQVKNKVIKDKLEILDT